MLELNGLDGFYGRSRALQSVSMDIDEGDFFSVLGRNGVGKTTLLRSVLGLMSRTSGSVKLDGMELNSLPTHARALAGIGYVPQGRGILPAFTVRENLMIGTFAAQSGQGEIADWVLELFPILKEFLNRRGGNLSGGQQQQLAIGRALLSQPKVLLLDEPTEGIQPNIVEQIEDVLIDLNRTRGLTIVLVEQNLTFARRASNRFAILDRGTVAVTSGIAQLSDDLVHEHLVV
ncbi:MULTISPECIES: urea ABC transporter ATP-binding subunit UrtE [Stappiaceae]|mgnify:FL=1|jgi:urea transport system ATP-binding protein|uniref:LIV-I protein F n=2 Tax=Roseibium TaxID=150830 RepID=A0A0M6YB01_9HYPH|nr:MULTISPECIES: urea ABC transporter ATP-binding subunit UrtE [Stappiaceae]MCR9285169.1 urea ABC transporter ATP-binding subunit UrtE [Paracoccaceae bacterium]MEC9471152.1 urea ABC transporter ATP-binding subunit UrtE [Pseudomonadota bacterium]AQQ08001.1 ABC transporter ATP-binding protein [Roseibium aggregatum]ERP90810.1 urea ABC transporter ATP-binding protein [Labrenzia sp. C1B10]ERS08538.1 urea ABC transporter ATP-binding protein [Labrenzia sp. C1B70]